MGKNDGTVKSRSITRREIDLTLIFEMAIDREKVSVEQIDRETKKFLDGIFAKIPSLSDDLLAVTPRHVILGNERKPWYSYGEANPTE